MRPFLPALLLVALAAGTAGHAIWSRTRPRIPDSLPVEQTLVVGRDIAPSRLPDFHRHLLWGLLDESVREGSRCSLAAATSAPLPRPAPAFRCTLSAAGCRLAGFAFVVRDTPAGPVYARVRVRHDGRRVAMLLPPTLPGDRLLVLLRAQPEAGAPLPDRWEGGLEITVDGDQPCEPRHPSS